MAQSDFNLEAFKSNFGDGARGNLFYYIPNFPAGVAVESIDKKGKFLVKSTSLPDTTIEEVAVNWQGYDFKYAGKHTFSDFAVIFNVDLKAGIRLSFENWISKKIHNTETNEYHKFEDYMKDQTLQLLGYDGTPIMTYKLYNAWPKALGAITLDYSASEIATFEVTFVYSHHIIKAGGE